MSKYKTPTEEELALIRKERPGIKANEVAVFRLEGYLGVLVYKEKGLDREFIIRI